MGRNRNRPTVLRALGRAPTHATCCPSRSVLLVALCGALSACVGEPGPFDGPPPDTPTLFAPELISTGQREYGITFTPDMREAYFTRRPRRGPSSILVTRWTGERWSVPEAAGFSVNGDEAAFITGDGTRMLFASRRMMPGTLDRSPNIWMMTRTAAGAWSSPSPVDGGVNTDHAEIDDYDVGSELGPSLTPSGQLLYWTGQDPDYGSDIWVAEVEGDGWAEPRPLRLNTPADERNPVISPDGRWLVFQSYREADAFGEQDLYVAERTDYGWSEPRLLPEPINSPRNDGYPSFSPDGRLFFFASDRDMRGGYYSIYYVGVEGLGLGDG